MFPTERDAMAEQRGAAAEPAPARTPPATSPADAKPRMSAAFATALGGAALLVGTVVTIVIVVQATSG